MKILYIITTGNIGGAQKYVLEQADYFKGTIAVGAEQTDLLDAATSRHAPTIKLKFMRRAINPVFDLLAFFELILVIIKVNPQIVHSNSTKAGILGSIAGKLCGKKTVFTVHGLSLIETNSNFEHKIYAVLEKFTSLFRNKLIAVSEYDKSLLLKHHITKSDKIAVVYNGIKPIEFMPKQQAITELGISDSKTIIGTVARLQRLKGIDNLVRSAALLPESIRGNTSIYIIGDGPDKLKIQTLITDLKLNDSVFLLGEIQNAASYLKAFDIFVLPSRYEGFPFGLIEAMSAGLPIVATNVGGVKEVLGTSGKLAEANTVGGLARAMTELLSKSNEWSELGLDAKNQSLKFSNTNMLAQTEDIYQKLLNNT